MAEMNAAFFEEAKYNLQHGKINFLNVAGLIPEVAEERHVVVRLPANSMHLNHVNIVYAGSYFVLAESSGATLIKCTYAGKYVPIKWARSDINSCFTYTLEDGTALNLSRGTTYVGVIPTNGGSANFS